MLSAVSFHFEEPLAYNWGKWLVLRSVQKGGVAKDDQSDGSDNTHWFYPPVREKCRSDGKLWKSLGSTLVARQVSKWKGAEEKRENW